MVGRCFGGCFERLCSGGLFGGGSPKKNSVFSRRNGGRKEDRAPIVPHAEDADPRTGTRRKQAGENDVENGVELTDISVQSSGVMENSPGSTPIGREHSVEKPKNGFPRSSSHKSDGGSEKGAGLKKNPRDPTPSEVVANSKVAFKKIMLSAARESGLSDGRHSSWINVGVGRWSNIPPGSLGANNNNNNYREVANEDFTDCDCE